MAFHSYTHLIGKLFNAYPFGPPSRVTETSSWTCVDHSVSRLPPLTKKRPLKTRFRCGCGTSRPSTSPVTATRRLIMQKARRHAQRMGAPTACRRTVSGSVSLFCAKCFSPFPHGTGSLSVSHQYLALPDGPGGFTQDSTCPALLRIPLWRAPLRVRGYHPLWRDFPDTSPRGTASNGAVLQPRTGLDPTGLGYSPSARRYSGNHWFIFFSSGY